MYAILADCATCVFLETGDLCRKPRFYNYMGDHLIIWVKDLWAKDLSAKDLSVKDLSVI